MCDVCVRERTVAGVASSPLCPISFGYCTECVANRAEPEWTFYYIYWDVGNGDPEKISDWINEISTWVNGKYYTWQEWLILPKRERPNDA